MGWTLRDTTFEAVIFDHDGTLVDTVTGDYRACSDLYDEHGVSLSAARWASIVCGNVAAYTTLFDELAAACGRPVAHDALRARLEHHWARHLAAPHVPLMPGVRELLAHLAELGVPMGVATAATRDWVMQWLAHYEIQHFFRSVSSGLECSKNKPHPEVYLRAAESLGVPPSACLVFEDSITGVLSAKAAGMTVVAIPVHLSRDLDFSVADAVLDSLAAAIPGERPR